MLEQYQEWNTIEQETTQEVIRRLLSQTFLLDRKYDKKSGRMTSDREYEFCAEHMAFLTEYFAVAGITIHQNYELGIIYIQGAEKQGERLTGRNSDLHVSSYPVSKSSMHSFHPFRSDMQPGSSTLPIPLPE